MLHGPAEIKKGFECVIKIHVYKIRKPVVNSFTSDTFHGPIMYAILAPSKPLQLPLSPNLF